MLAACSAFLIGHWSFLLLLIGASLLVGYSEIIFTFNTYLTHWRCFFSVWASLFVGSYAVVSCLSAALLHELEVYESFNLSTGLLLGLSGPTLLKLKFFQPLGTDKNTPKSSVNIASAWRALCFANLKLVFANAHTANKEALMNDSSSNLRSMLEQLVGEQKYETDYRQMIENISDEAEKQTLLAYLVNKHRG